MAAAKHYHVEPQIGDGIYLVSDVAKILNLDYDKVRRWIVGYWDGSLQENTSYVFGEKKNRKDKKDDCLFHNLDFLFSSGKLGSKLGRFQIIESKSNFFQNLLVLSAK